MARRVRNIAAQVEIVDTANKRRWQVVAGMVETVDNNNFRVLRNLIVMVKVQTAPSWPVEKYGPKAQMMG